MKDVIYEMKREMFRRKYSIRTIQTYCWAVNCFFKHTKVADLRKIRKSDIKEYLNTLHNKAGSTINVNLQALKFMMEEVLNKNCRIHIRFSKVPLKIVDYLTKEELIELINAIENKKHKLIVLFMYSTGLRASEVLDLRIEDLDFKIGRGIVRNGKGGKSRYFKISEKIKDELEEFTKNRNGFVFTGRNGRLTIRSLQELLRKASIKAKIKNVHPHMLRHSFATHLAQSGTNDLILQSLMGHSDIKSTYRYTHGNMNMELKSPLDALNIN